MKIIVMLPMMVSNGFELVALAQVPPDSITIEQNTTTLIGQAIILITTVLGFLYNIYRENRNRRWDLQDREQQRAILALKVEEHQKTLAAKVDTTAKAVEQKVELHQQELASKIDANTKISADAFKEANDFNRKIAVLLQTFNDVKGPAHLPIVVEQKKVLDDQKVVLEDQKIVLDDQKTVLEEQKKIAIPEKP